ncbi:hotdog fold thioesterase [Mycolicibacterium sp.]|uniref:PaaI family thioesterase n=1 Tax=Mycolicibacterium sp. TaxID=2320850 RepID=UPI003D14A9F6
MPYPPNTPLGRFGVANIDAGPRRFVATMPVSGLVNPLTGAATVAPLTLLVDHIGGLVNHTRRGADEWTLTSELTLEVVPGGLDLITAAPDTVVTATAHPVGSKARIALARCDLMVGAGVVATATVRSFYTALPARLTTWREPEIAGQTALRGRSLADLLAVRIGETGSAARVLLQDEDPALDNNAGMVHGGASAMALELVASAAVQTPDPDAQMATGSLRVNYLRPFHSGGGAHYLATPLRVGRASAVADATAVNADGTVALRARLTAYR